MKAELIGSSPAARELVGHVARIAASSATVLITGETGTGKGLIARTLHDGSPRKGRPFLHVDCAALSETVVESELFGHERGAFTGAHQRRRGRFEQVEDGTIFLDEIGELTVRLQTKLLRVLEDRTFERIGGDQCLRMSARVVAATNVDLATAVAGGRFRADLYYRLAVLELRCPPLRARLSDIPLLVEHGLREAARRSNRPPRKADGSFLQGLMAYRWPGNVRELRNVLERALVLGGDEEAPLTAADLPAAFGGSSGPKPGFRPHPESAIRGAGPSAGRDIASELIATGGNVARAARRLNLPRSTLRHRIRTLQLEHLIPTD